MSEQCTQDIRKDAPANHMGKRQKKILNFLEGEELLEKAINCLYYYTEQISLNRRNP